MPTDPQRVLVVEDEEDVRYILEDEFSYQGFEVVSVETADAAAVALAGGAFSVLVTDVETPGTLSGLDLMKIARAQSPPLPTVLITGYASDVRPQVTALERVISKPFPLTEVVSVVEDLLRSLNRA